MCRIRSKIKEDEQNTQHAAAQLIIQLQRRTVPVDSMLKMKEECSTILGGIAKLAGYSFSIGLNHVWLSWRPLVELKKNNFQIRKHHRSCVSGRCFLLVTSKIALLISFVYISATLPSGKRTTVLWQEKKYHEYMKNEYIVIIAMRIFRYSIS